MFGHGSVTNPYLQVGLDLLTVVVLTAPLWTAYLWGVHRRGGLLALVGCVQIPAAIAGFVPVVDHELHAAVLVGALLITVGALWMVRRAAARDRVLARTHAAGAG